MPQASDPPAVTLKVLTERCSENCAASFAPGSRPFLVEVAMNAPAKVACMMRVGKAPEDVIVCVNHTCGALFQALAALAPLQELVK